MHTFLKYILLTGTALLLQESALAQVYRCDLGNNRVVYSDTPCASKAGQTKLDIQADPTPPSAEVASTEKNRYMVQLDAAVKDAIAKKDFQRAEKLALTQQHRDWIDQARQQNPSPAKQAVADKANSAECIAARNNYQQGFDQSSDSPEDMESRAIQVQQACGTAAVEPTYVQRPPYINRPAFGFPYLNPNSSQPGAAVPSPMGGRANPVR